MTSQTRKQIITIHILPNISRSKGNQAIKFGRLIKYWVENIFLKNYAENEVGRLIPELFLFFKKELYKVKVSGQNLSFNIFWQTSTWTYNKNKLYNISDC